MHTPNPKSNRQRRINRNRQAGAALIIAMFTLLLVSAVALSLVMASGTESSLAGNYRSSTSAYYAGLAGVEEARGRLLPTSPQFFNKDAATPNFVTVNGALPTLAPGQVRYIINPANGEVVDPVTQTNQYADKEYQNEWANSPGPWPATLPPVGAGTQYVNSIYLDPQFNPAGTQGPMFKWVRITPATEQSLGIDVDGSGGALDNQKEVFYDATLANATGANDSLTLTPSVAGTSAEVFQITADAVMPNGSQKLMQYVVAPFTFNLNLPSALTMPGPIGSFNPPNSIGYCMDGNDTSQVTTNGIPGTNCSFTPAPPVPGCSTTAPAVPAVGVSTGLDNAGSQTNTDYVDTQIPRPKNYVGSTGTTPSVSTPGLPQNLSSPQQLDQELGIIQQNANVCLGCSGPGGGTYTFSSIDTASGSLWTSCGTSCGTTPQITYVNGNMDISGSTTGSGILVVTGNLTYNGASSWNGIILVVGNGLTTYLQNGGGNGQFNGGIFVANTDGITPDTYGASDFTINGGGGNGIYYNSCWIANSQKPPRLQVLSYKEIQNP